jgi:hypothetical protein
MDNDFNTTISTRAGLHQSREKTTRREKNLMKAAQKAIDAKSLKDARVILQEALGIVPEAPVETAEAVQEDVEER